MDNGVDLSFNTASVLIQQNCPNISYADNNSFNTASVLIQQENGDLLAQRMLFQYSFCSYSTFVSRFAVELC